MIDPVNGTLKNKMQDAYKSCEPGELKERDFTFISEMLYNENDIESKV
jgi:hypothetical protein